LVDSERGNLSSAATELRLCLKKRLNIRHDLLGIADVELFQDTFHQFATAVEELQRRRTDWATRVLTDELRELYECRAELRVELQQGQVGLSEEFLVVSTRSGRELDADTEFDALEGDQETEIVRYLLRLRDSLSRQKVGQELTAEAEAARAEVINIVNNFFYEKLTAVPEIRGYMDRLKA